jgi:hypothetical protein
MGETQGSFLEIEEKQEEGLFICHLSVTSRFFLSEKRTSKSPQS